jgi:hypothetical protein
MVNIIDKWFLFINSSYSTNQSKTFSLSHSVIFSVLKILSLAIIFACFIRKSDNDKEAAEYLDDDICFDLEEDEEYLHSIKVCFIMCLIF